MSPFLRDALRNKATAASGGNFVPGRPQKSRSSGASTSGSLRTVAQSLTSIFSGSGGQPKKRRRAPVSRLGCPEFYVRDPPPARPWEGVDTLPVDAHGPYTTAHAQSLVDKTRRPWLSLVIYSHASPRDKDASYYDEACIRGEIRLQTDRSMSLSKINVWLIGRMYLPRCSCSEHMVYQLASLWPPEGRKQTFFGRSEKLKGTYVWRFSFQLPRDVAVCSEVAQARTGKGYASVPLPPSFLSKIPGFGVEVSYRIVLDADHNTLSLPFRYTPRTQPIPQPDIPFPFMPARGDWPFTRELINGWLITPFGGRGKFRQELSEIEGLIGVRYPAVFGPGEVIRFKLLLWSTNPALLDSISHPSCIRVELSRALILGDGVLDSVYTGYDRNLQPLAEGSIWVEGQHYPTHSSKASSVTAVSAGEDEEFGVSSLDSAMRRVSLGGTEPPSGKLRNRMPSPTPSENDEAELPGSDNARIVRMDGYVTVPKGRPKPSFRYVNAALEYLVLLGFLHPDYVHISPKGPFQTEFPVAITTDPKGWTPPTPRQVRTVVVGNAVDVSGEGVTQMEEVKGGPTRKMRNGRF